ncbi:uncharacterized protein TRUGW13939_06776 [Talaromyces rugulosus]|uniref:Cytochrome P450 n=1 Tax=Talaromyces rugulosus TaxID=121627 RepID=A0A7H8QZT8_TALRU|nr:uncharacterized protein TRUGW13939_06776 [Talaromyces rugulosus]QKX59639.1 hypothetical protein TRUGW13939_06776 [Talaromyces rugulosus]
MLKHQSHHFATYGEMTTIHVGSKLWVLLNSNRVAEEIYNKRGKITNGRPSYPILGDLISQNRRSILLPQEKWSQQRRLMHQLLGGTALVTYQEYQNEESLRLLASYSKDPAGWYRHHLHYSSAVIHRIAFGERPREFDENLQGVAKAQEIFLLNAPPYNLLDSFPELAKLPKWLQFWRKRYQALGKKTDDWYGRYWDPIHHAIKSETAPDSFAQRLISDKTALENKNIDPKWLSMVLVEAGSDTTRLTLNIFALAASLHRDKYLEARAEIDAVCGNNAERLSTFADEVKMPYTLAFIKELLRWRPIFTWTPEHTLTEDLKFEGYSFPKGTHFVLNHAALCKDISAFDDANAFKPERWLDGHQSDLTHGLWQLGGGRRVCVGYRVAQKSLFINMSRLIYCFDYEAREAFDSSDIKHFELDEPFPITPKIRSLAHAKLLERVFENLSDLN